MAPFLSVNGSVNCELIGGCGIVGYADGLGVYVWPNDRWGKAAGLRHGQDVLGRNLSPFRNSAMATKPAQLRDTDGAASGSNDLGCFHGA